MKSVYVQIRSIFILIFSRRDRKVIAQRVITVLVIIHEIRVRINSVLIHFNQAIRSLYENFFIFSIHIIKGTSGETYTGKLWIYAETDTTQYGQGPYPTSPYGPFYGEQAPTGTPTPPSFEPTP